MRIEQYGVSPLRRLPGATIRVNQSLFDDWVVVTSQADAGTIAVCQRYGVRTAFCPYFKHRGEQFAKAAAINIGLAHLKLGDWALHLDADTAVPGTPEAPGERGAGPFVYLRD